MHSYFTLLPNTANQLRTFVMIDNAGVEVAGLGAGFTLQISKVAGAFAPSAGVKAEISNGFYAYTFTAAEVDTPGALSVRVTGVGCIQQNLVFLVHGGVVGAVPYPYTFTNSITGLPIAGADVWITTDLAGLNVIWNGTTDAFGVARDGSLQLPYLLQGSTVYVWCLKTGYTTDAWPDIEIVP